MLEVLKQLYGEAVTEESFDAFKEELGKRFVPKSEFNQRGEELKQLREKVAQQTEELAELQNVAEEKAALVEALSAAEAKQAELIATYESQAEAERLRLALDQALHASGARNLIAVKALLNMESITLEEGVLKGLEEQLWELKKENSYLFEAEQQTVQFMRPARNNEADLTPEEFKKLGYMERLKLKKEQPELYLAMTQKAGGNK